MFFHLGCLLLNYEYPIIFTPSPFIGIILPAPSPSRATKNSEHNVAETPAWIGYTKLDNFHKVM